MAAMEVPMAAKEIKRKRMKSTCAHFANSANIRSPRLSRPGRGSIQLISKFAVDSVALMYMLLIVLIITPAFSGESTCVDATADDQPMATALNEQPDTPVNHVIYVAIDGLKLSCQGTTPKPILHFIGQLKSRSSWTLNGSRTTIPPISGPAWTAQLTSLDPNMSGVVTNSWKPRWGNFIPSRELTPTCIAAGGLPTAFRILKLHDPRIHTSMFYCWDWLTNLGNRGHPDTVDFESLCNGSTVGRGPCDLITKSTSLAHLERKIPEVPKSFSFIYMGNVDSIGHTYGWCSRRYIMELSVVMRHLQDIVTWIDALARDDVMMVVATDHGGALNNHVDWNDHCLQVPVFFSGPGVKSDYEIKQAISTTDYLPTVFQLMGIPACPLWRGRVIDQIFV